MGIVSKGLEAGNVKLAKKKSLKNIIILFFCVFLFSLFCFFWVKKIWCSTGSQQGTILLLDGPSCSGKTSIAKELIKLFGPGYEIVSLDDFVADLFLENIKKKLPKKEFLKKICHKRDLMYKKIVSLVCNGKNVLVDTVLSGLEGKKDVRRCFETLQDIDVYLVLVYCPLYKVVDRLKERNRMAFFQQKPKEMRSIFATLQFSNCYKKTGASLKNFLQEDVFQKGLGSLSRKDIEISYFAHQNLPDKLKAQYNMVKQKLLLHFGLEYSNCVKIISQLNYDCIVDTNKKSPLECAKEVYTFLAVRNLANGQANKQFYRRAFAINLQKMGIKK
ncbi:AAA family ATPase [Candidatus Dependentiae bacterium]